tara:strand:- start:309 stop:440 length:132 start_codon:yes stop_codon:yes gene_type:complete
MVAKAYKGKKVLEFNDSPAAREQLAKFGYVFKKPAAKKAKKAE